ncbi:MAG: histidine--tRNA ligase [Geodermatophilaceae bacterium]|nr:histidine--tRNA ligase [Geodermatophilaceae bacterium]
MALFSAPKGTYDIVPPGSEDFLAVRAALARPATLAGYGYVETPMFEDTALFARGVGESTDVVSKEMYTFDDKGGRSLSLRPEGTAGVMRAVLEHSLHSAALPVKLWYAGPNFRYERPQAGRYRHFTQVGVEAIGIDDPTLDAEVVALADDGFRATGLSGFRLLLTSLGDAVCRPAYRGLLLEFLRGVDLDSDTRRRAEINPLRVLDDKRPQVQAQLADAPLMADHLCADCATHYDVVRARLRGLDVVWEEAPRLVRGLDYYTRTTFEFVHDGLGAQSAIGGGGRYNGLSTAIGGPDLPGVGWALGVDRVLLARVAEGVAPADPARCRVFGVPLGEAATAQMSVLIGRLRRVGVSADMAYGGRGLKGAMKAADRSGATYAVVLGERDLAAGAAQVKDLRTGEQDAVALDILLPTLQEKLS